MRKQQFINRLIKARVYLGLISIVLIIFHPGQGFSGSLVAEIKIEKAGTASAASHQLSDLKAIHSGSRKLTQYGYSRGWANARSSGAANADPIVATLKLRKNDILNRSFLYGGDLQYSSMMQAHSLYLQSLAVGHEIAKFRIFGDRLQLIADQDQNFESNINHPKLLIHEFPIEAQDAATLTVQVRAASPALLSIAEQAKNARANHLDSLD